MICPTCFSLRYSVYFCRFFSLGLWSDHSTEAKPNVITYGYGRNWFYFLQRATGVFLFIFILFHILHLRFGLVLNSIPIAGNADQSFNIVSGEFQAVWVLAFMSLALRLPLGISLTALAVCGRLGHHYRSKGTKICTICLCRTSCRTFCGWG